MPFTAVALAASIVLALLLGMPGVALAGVGLSDGTYTVEVVLEGGSGRASVSSPAELAVSGGDAVATIEWSSPNYDQMVVDCTQYLPINKDGNSTFVIPVQTLDEPLAVSAETTAMSEPHMIDYSLVFDAATVTEKRPEGLFGPGLGGAGTAAVVAGLALLAGGIVFMQRRGGADGSGGPGGLGGRKGRAGR